MNHIAFENELCARLLAQAQVLRRQLTQRAWEANLTVTDFLALRYLIRSIYPSSPGEIARVLGCSRSNATKVVHRLEAAGYVRITLDVFAPKLKSISVTNAGRDAYARAHHRNDPVDRFSRLSEQDRKDLYRLLGLVGPRSREEMRVG
jgi:DNA-binding MarR family transcriptional regulator